MREYRSIPPHDLLLGEKIGEGQFGDVHSGFLYPKVCWGGWGDGTGNGGLQNESKNLKEISNWCEILKA